jgi:hypothetical protein
VLELGSVNLGNNAITFIQKDDDPNSNSTSDFGDSFYWDNTNGDGTISLFSSPSSILFYCILKHFVLDCGVLTDEFVCLFVQVSSNGSGALQLRTESFWVHSLSIKRTTSRRVTV